MSRSPPRLPSYGSHIRSTASLLYEHFFRKDVPGHVAFRFVPFAVDTCGYMGKEAVACVKRLGDSAAESGNIPKGAFVIWAMQLLSVTVQHGNAEMYRRSGLIISREQGLRPAAAPLLRLLPKYFARLRLHAPASHGFSQSPATCINSTMQIFVAFLPDSTLARSSGDPWRGWVSMISLTLHPQLKGNTRAQQVLALPT